MAKEGWEFYCDDNGRTRRFMVGEENEETAKRAVQTFAPELTDLNFVSKSRVSWHLIEQLGLIGKGAEWNLSQGTFRVGGVDIGSQP
jgi:hypothetical protein